MSKLNVDNLKKGIVETLAAESGRFHTPLETKAFDTCCLVVKIQLKTGFQEVLWFSRSHQLTTVVLWLHVFCEFLAMVLADFSERMRSKSWTAARRSSGSSWRRCLFRGRRHFWMKDGDWVQKIYYS